MNLYLLASAPAKSGGGIYQYALGANGKLTPVSRFSCDKPMYSVVQDGALHTVLNNMGNEPEGAYFSQPIGAGGALGAPTALMPSQGEVPCHLAVQNGNTYLVNYVTGNVVKNGTFAVQHSGSGPHRTRQERAHTHFVSVLPDGLLGVCDLGTDTLHIYDGDLSPVGTAQVPCGYGIRHFITKRVGDGYQIYAINELVPSISRFAYRGGVATYLDTVMIPCTAERLTAAAIRLSHDGKHLYASVRGENILCKFDIAADGTLALTQAVSCGGDGPRDFDVTDTHLICTNQLSNSVTVFLLEEDGNIGEMTDMLSLPQPLCVVIL